MGTPFLLPWNLGDDDFLAIPDAWTGQMRDEATPVDHPPKVEKTPVRRSGAVTPVDVADVTPLIVDLDEVIQPLNVVHE